MSEHKAAIQCGTDCARQDVRDGNKIKCPIQFRGDPACRVPDVFHSKLISLMEGPKLTGWIKIGRRAYINSLVFFFFKCIKGHSH